MNLDWLKVFYIVGALVMVAMAIVIYPTLRENAKQKSSKKSK